MDQSAPRVYLDEHDIDGIRTAAAANPSGVDIDNSTVLALLQTLDRVTQVHDGMIDERDERIRAISLVDQDDQAARAESVLFELDRVMRHTDRFVHPSEVSKLIRDLAGSGTPFQAIVRSAQADVLRKFADGCTNTYFIRSLRREADRLDQHKQED